MARVAQVPVWPANDVASGTAANPLVDGEGAAPVPPGDEHADRTIAERTIAPSAAVTPFGLERGRRGRTCPDRAITSVRSGEPGPRGEPRTRNCSARCRRRGWN